MTIGEKTNIAENRLVLRKISWLTDIHPKI